MHDCLHADGLCTYYKLSQALFDITIRVPARGVVAILGRNGAGKTTLLKTLAGDLTPARGNIVFSERTVTHVPTEQRVRLGLGHVPQEKDVFAGLTVRENLVLGAMVAADRDANLEQVTELFPRLGQRLSQKAGTLSGGERKMLAISRVLLGKPRLIMLDEPTEGVWHGVVDEIAHCLERLGRDTAVLIVEQHVDLALRLAQYCYVMDRGTVALEGSSDDIRNNPRLERLLAP